VDEVSTKQKLILLSAVQQLVSSPHPTKFDSKLGRVPKKCHFNPVPLLLKWWVTLGFLGLGSLWFSMGPIEK
jgi:hypothetical protein